MLNIFNKITTTLALSAVILGGLGLGFSGVKAEAASGYKLPYPSGVTLYVVQGYNGNHSHLNTKALDFSGSEGVKILASKSGKIVRVVSGGKNNLNCNYNGTCKRDNNFNGNYVVIDHGNGEISWYLHLLPNSIKVSAGNSVLQGQEIAKLGNTGDSTGPHLDFRVCNNGGSSTCQTNQTTNVYFDELSGSLAQQGKSYTSKNSTASTPATICGFVDIASIPDQSVKDAICSAKNKGLFNGNTVNGLVYFRPNDQITRGEIAIVAERLNLIPKNTSCTPFKDTSDSSITNLKCNGIVGGYKDGTFKPNNVATRAEADLILTRILAKAGRSNSTLFGDQTRPNDNITRAEFAIIAVRASLR